MSVRVAVVGHVEWLIHARGPIAPRGQITALSDVLEEPAGGGAVTAVKLARLGAECHFFTALGNDELGRASRDRLANEGVTVHAVERDMPQTRALSIVEPGEAERTIMVIGEPVGPAGSDDLPWEVIGRCEAAYFTGYDEASLQAARQAQTLIGTARRQRVLEPSLVQLDVLVKSASDRDEALDPRGMRRRPVAVVETEGERGGTITVGDRPPVRYPPAPLPGRAIDSYGAGDSFVAGLTVGLGEGLGLPDAVAKGAAAAAGCLTVRGGLG